MRPKLLTLFLCLYLLLLNPIVAQPRDEKYLITEFVKSKKPDTRRDSAIRLFQKASDESLKAMLTNESDDVAIGAAWEILLRVSDKKLGRRHDDDRPLDPDKTAWFIDYLQTRMKLTIPPMWVGCLKHAKSRGTYIFIDSGDSSPPYDQVFTDFHDVLKDGMYVFKGVDLSEDNKGFHVGIGKDEVVVIWPLIYAMTNYGYNDYLSANIVNHKMAIVVHAEMPTN